MHGDARRYAASILKHLELTPLKDSFSCYGTHNSVLIGIGRDSSLGQVKTDSLDDVWAYINNYIEANTNEYIFGFIGFDPANQLNKIVTDYQQKIDLFVPETVIECNQSGCTVRKGKIDTTTISELPDLQSTNPVDISELDQAELRGQYAESASCFIDAIQAGLIERATLSRKISTPREFDLAGTFISDSSSHLLARSFYFSSQHIAFAGQSPELLAEGNTGCFATHKLSGTCAKTENTSITDLVSRFRADHRIITEHQSAISTIKDSLGQLGTVKATEFEVMELPTLLHGWSQFVTRPNKRATVADCLRRIFPFGVKPVERGFKLLAQHENFCRGPYYGLTGCILPGGEFSFTQVLRAAFIDNAGSYLIAGAAITQNSTPEIEVAETCTKLSGVQVFEHAND